MLPLFFCEHSGMCQCVLVCVFAKELFNFSSSSVLFSCHVIELHQLCGIPIDDWKLQLQANQVFNVSSRITRAMVEIALQSMQMQTCVSVFKLEQAIETRCYSEFSTIWSQFDAIGQKHSAALFGHVETIQQFKTFDSFQLECLIGKATAQKLKDSVAKLPIFAPQLLEIRFLDRNNVTQDCKWEVKMLIQSMSALRESRVNILAGIWRGCAAVVKRHFLLQDDGPANNITFTITTKPNERNIIIHMAVLSCSYAGIDREIIYKCAVNWADPKKPFASRIEEVNEKTLEVLGKKKADTVAANDHDEEFQENDQQDDSQATHAKRKPKQIAQKDQSMMNADEPLKFTEKQLRLLPNKALKTVSAIKRKKQDDQRFELTDEENESAFQEELFKQMDHPQSTEKHHQQHYSEVGEGTQRSHESSIKEFGMMRTKFMNEQNQGKPMASNRFRQDLSVPIVSPKSQQKKSTAILQTLHNKATKTGRQIIQDELQETTQEFRNPFANFAYKHMQSDLPVSKTNDQALQNVTLQTACAKTLEFQQPSLKKLAENDLWHSAGAPKVMYQQHSGTARSEGLSWFSAEQSEEKQDSRSGYNPKNTETKVAVPQNSNMVQVVN